jgi:elongation factor G
LFCFLGKIQVPIGLEGDFQGLVDLVQLKAYFFQWSVFSDTFVSVTPVVKFRWHYSSN